MAINTQRENLLPKVSHTVKKAKVDTRRYAMCNLQLTLELSCVTGSAGPADCIGQLYIAPFASNYKALLQLWPLPSCPHVMYGGNSKMLCCFPGLC